MTATRQRWSRRELLMMAAAAGAGGVLQSSVPTAEALCIGSTHQAGFRDVLQRLAALPYVARIEPFVGE